jgi:hypothetical protein
MSTRSRSIPRNDVEDEDSSFRSRSKQRKSRSTNSNRAKKSITEKKREPGCSNYRKYPDVPLEDFCGAEGGSCKTSFPVDTPEHAIAALRYARYAPYEEKLRKCVYRKAKEKGFYDEEKGTISRSKSKSKARSKSRSKARSKSKSKARSKSRSKGRSKARSTKRSKTRMQERASSPKRRSRSS